MAKWRMVPRHLQRRVWATYRPGQWDDKMPSGAWHDAADAAIAAVAEKEQRLREMTTVVASVSGGKDSAAMCLWFQEQGIEHRRVFLDTGWEHPETYEYIRGELTQMLGPIEEVRGQRTMEELVRYKRMFPSRLRRYCTEELKVFPMRDFLATLGGDLVNAVGIRAAESEARAKMPEREWSKTFDCEVWRPLIAWSETDVIEIHRRHGLRPNPLYFKGATRVGCWPCIFARKSEIRMIAEIDPGRIVKLRTMERDLSERAGEPRAWFHGSSRTGPTPIDEVVTWARTARGGKQFELFQAEPRDAGCMRWGMCDTNDGDPKEALEKP